MPMSHEVLGRGAKPDRVRDGRGARLELVRDVVELRSAQVDLADHVAAGEERGHGLEQLASRPERARAHRGEHLVPAERVEVGAECLDIHRHVRNGLGAVDQHQRPGRVGHVDHLADRVDRAQRVRHVGEGDELGLQPEEHLEDVEAEDPVVGDRDELEIPVHFLDEELPRDEVGVVLHLGEDDLVAAADVLAPPRVGHEVDRLGGVAREDDLVRVRRIDEPRGRLARGPRRRPWRARPACRCRGGRWRCRGGNSRRPRR